MTKISKKSKIHLTSLLLGVSGSVLLSSPVLASTGSDPFSNFWNQLTQQFTSIKSSFLAEFNSFGELINETVTTDFNKAISEAMGALGIADPEVLRAEIEGGISNEQPIYSADTIANEVDRQITRSVATSALSKEGQQKQLQQLENTRNSVNQIQQISNQAQSSQVTQEVMKHIANQNAINGALMGQVSQQMQEVSQNQQLTNVNLTNISRAVDGQNQMQQQEKLGAGFDTFRTSSLAGLF
jgi:hypothetical protein